MLHIGFNNYVSKEEICSILEYRNTSKMRDFLAWKEERRELFRLTKGKSAKSVILTKSGLVYLSAIKAETLAERFGKE